MRNGTMHKVTNYGRLGQDPEVIKESPLVVKISLPEEDINKDKEVVTHWHRFTLFQKKADFCRKYLRKGDLVHIEAKMRRNEYKKAGETHTVTDLIITDIQLLDRLEANKQKIIKATGDTPLSDII